MGCVRQIAMFDSNLLGGVAFRQVAEERLYCRLCDVFMYCVYTAWTPAQCTDYTDFCHLRL